ncbi:MULTISPECIES: cysteine hydrolase family protein [unclassified Bacillus (in: firmicutes)]|uniref:cysteine hydrolase family protein n=1 Tax=unclassified Bacillus (in: firmicutes) TaxID=185979 RepID=UPI000B87F344|nr:MULTISPECIES: cysteine hydrolase family protein [unclassified Bacillus (in: firmicutes)]
MPQDTALIIVDVQQAFNDPSWGRRNNPQAEKNILRLLAHWRKTERPIFHIQHTSRLTVGSLFYHLKDTHKFKEGFEPHNDEPVLQKNVNSSFIGTDLEQRLREKDIRSIVVVGLTTNHCVETTTRMAGNFGFDTYLVSDATATFDRKGPDGEIYAAETIHNMTLVNLNEEFATIIDTDTLLSLS